MALSQNMTTDNKYIVYYVEVIQNSQNIANNTSNVTVKVWIKRTNTGYETYGTGTVYCTINGTQYTASITTSQTITSSPRVLLTKTLDIAHNSDGTKVLTTATKITHSRVNSSPATQNYNYTLTNIPRASGVSVPSSVNAGSTLTVTIDRKVSSFRHNVYYSFGNHRATLMDTNSTATSVNYTIPLDHLTAIPNSTSGTATVSVDTFNGSTLIGSSSKNFTINAPSNIIPTFTGFVVEPVEAGADISYGYVQGKSKAKATVSGQAGIYGSTIKSATITGAGFTGTSNPFTTGVLSKAGTFEFSAYVTDSRGRNSASRKVSITVYAYENPKITSFTAIRCLIDGTANEDGTYFKASLKYTISSVNNKNTATARIFYKLNTDTSYPSTSSIIQNNSDLVEGNGTILNDKSYDIKVEVTDKFHTSSLNVNISQSFITMDFKKGGRGIAIGKASETDNLLEIDIPVKFNKGAEGATSGDVIKASKGSTTYWGMLGAEGENNVYIRTTIQGLLPYEPSGSSYLGTSGWPFNYIHCKDFICQRLIENTGTPTNNAPHIRLNTNDGNGQGDGKTHIGYITNGAYNHYFRGKGKMNINMGLGAFISGTCTVGDYVIIGDYDDSWNAVVTRRIVAGKNMQSKMGTSTGIVKLTSTSTQYTSEATCVTLETNADATVTRVNITRESVDPNSDNVTYLGTSARRWEACYVATGTVYSSSKEEKKNIKYFKDMPSVFSKEKPVKIEDIILNGIKNTELATFNYINKEDINYIGFIANDIKNKDKDFLDLLGGSYIREDTGTEQFDINQLNINGVLWSGLQQALNKIDLLEERINELEKKKPNK